MTPGLLEHLSWPFVARGKVPNGGLRMSRLWNAEVIPWAMKAIMPELSLRVPFVFVHKGHTLDNGR